MSVFTYVLAPGAPTSMCECGCHLTSVVLLTAEGRAKIGDVGLARFMPNDYLSTAAATGTVLTRKDP